MLESFSEYLTTFFNGFISTTILQLIYRFSAYQHIIAMVLHEFDRMLIANCIAYASVYM